MINSPPNYAARARYTEACARISAAKLSGDAQALLLARDDARRARAELAPSAPSASPWVLACARVAEAKRVLAEVRAVVFTRDGTGGTASPRYPEYTKACKELYEAQYAVKCAYAVMHGLPEPLKPAPVTLRDNLRPTPESYRVPLRMTGHRGRRPRPKPTDGT